MQYVQVTDGEDAEAIEIPTEDDGALTVAAIASQYPGATGLKYRIDGHVRAVKISDGKLFAPEGGWGDHIYQCMFPKAPTETSIKRKADESSDISDVPAAKVSKTDTANNSNSSSWVHTDLVVLGLPWKVTDKELNDYFSKFGELQLAQVKTDPLTNKSKGYGFVRFAEQEVQVRVMLERHRIEGRWCDVRIPVSKDSVGKKSPYKVFVGQCTEDLTEDVLREYFSKFGEISDLYVPKPFRAFAFVTFVESNVAKGVCVQEHIIKNTKVQVTEAVPKLDSDKYGDRGGFGRQSKSSVSYGSRYGGSRRGDSYSGGGGGSGGRGFGHSQSDGYDSYVERRGPWNSGSSGGVSGREGGWQDGWNDDSGNYNKDWRPKPSSNWPPSSSTQQSSNRWHEDSVPVAEPKIDPSMVREVVNQAVMGVIGSLKGAQVPTPPPISNNGYGNKDQWWSRR